MQKVLKIVSVSILILAALSLFGYWVGISVKEDSSSPINKFLKNFVTFPDKVSEVLGSKEIRNIPPTFGTHHSFEHINKLSYDVFGLNAFYGTNDDYWEIRLFNFRTDSVLHQWRFYKKDFLQTDRQFANSEPRNPILLPNRSIIAACDETKNLFRLDENSTIMWHNQMKRFHHSLNLAADSNIWVCTMEKKIIYNRPHKSNQYYEDEFITKVNAQTGEIMYDKSLSEILMENGYKNFVFGFANRVGSHFDDDPLHLNDIEAVLDDGIFWKKGDLFLSLRHKSLVIHYRPATNKIVRLIYGPFLNQHDVDIISDTEISIFNNNGTMIGKMVDPDNDSESGEPQEEFKTSNIIIYDFADSSFRSVLDEHFIKDRIYTDTQGFQQKLSTGDYYIEYHQEGILYFMNEEEVIYKRQFEPTIDDWVERPHWVRIYENVNF